MELKRLAIIVPCYNEEAVFPYTVTELSKVLQDLIKKEKIRKDSYILFVNDGSQDRTWRLITAVHEKCRHVSGINLAGNVGHQNALMAGLEYAKEHCDMSISIDADLQDDIGVIEEMVDKYNDGVDIVYGVRDNRDSDSWFKRNTAQGYYWFLSKMGVKVEYNHADFRLMSRRAMEALLQYPEKNLFLRGLVPTLGFRTDSVYYERKARSAGESKYTLKKMLALAWQGITSFSLKPITALCGLGVAGMLLSMLVFCIIWICCGMSLGLAALASMWFLASVLLAAIGLVGEYVGKTYIETKSRPRYIIESVLPMKEGNLLEGCDPNAE